MGWLDRKKVGGQRCPECDEPIEADAVNIKEGVALCGQCGQLTRLSELNDSRRSRAEIIEQPPTGCSLISTGQGVVLRASMRSMAGFLPTAGFALFWNGLLSVFLLIAGAALYSNLIGPLPAWFPAAGLKDGKPIMNDKPMDLGATLFLCVFLTPFVIVGVGMTMAALINLVGRVDVVLEESNSCAATGIGPFTWKRRFDPHCVQSVRLITWSWQESGEATRQIELVANRTVKFAGLLQQDRKVWLHAVLRELLVPSPARRRSTALPELPWLLGPDS